jgi:hypothetical protein
MILEKYVHMYLTKKFQYMVTEIQMMTCTYVVTFCDRFCTKLLSSILRFPYNNLKRWKISLLHFKQCYRWICIKAWKKSVLGPIFRTFFSTENHFSRKIPWNFLKNQFFKTFSRKIQFFPNLFGGKFSAEFSPKFSPEKMYEK